MNVRSVDFLSEDKKAESQNGNAKTADTSTQETKTEPKVAAIQIPKKAIALAKSVGIDLNIIVGAFQQLNDRVENTEKAITILAQTNERLMPLVELAERAKQAQQAQAQAQARGETPSQSGVTGLDIGGIIKDALKGGGGGMDEELLTLNKELLRASISKIYKDSASMDAIRDAIVGKIASKAAMKIIEE